MSLNRRVLGPVLMLAGLWLVRSGFSGGWRPFVRTFSWALGILIIATGWVLLKDRTLND